MTSEIKMNQRPEESTDSDENSAKRNKQKEIQDKLKDMGVMHSKKQESDAPSRRFPAFLIVFLLALPVAAISVYAFMPEEVNKLLLLSELSTNDSVSDNASDSKADSDSRQAFKTNTGVTDSAQNRSGFATQFQSQGDTQTSPHSQHNKWMVERQAEFEKRRAEFYKRNANKQSEFDSRYQHNQQAYNQMPRGTTWGATPQQPPQWVIDQQAEMQKQRDRYMQEIKEQQSQLNNQSQWTSSNDGNTGSNAHEYKRPEYFNHPRMNNDQPQQNVNSPFSQSQQPAVVYQQNPPQYYNPYGYRGQPSYYNAPVYQYRPYNRPYGWQGPWFR